MKTTVMISTIGLAAMAAGTAFAQEVGRVISSTPIVQQVAVNRQVCGQQPMAMQQPNSGVGAVMGAVVGGALGNAIGHGTGRAAATMLGVIGGAALGNNAESSGAQVQNMQQCSTQTVYENQTTGYNVTYEYAGRQYAVQMPQDPGPTIQLQVAPMGMGAQPGQPMANSGVVTAPPMSAQPMITAPPVGYPGYQAQPYYAPPAYYAPAYTTAYAPYYAPSYYAPYYYGAALPLRLSLNLGYSRSYGGYSGRRWR